MVTAEAVADMEVGVAECMWVVAGTLTSVVGRQLAECMQVQISRARDGASEPSAVDLSRRKVISKVARLHGQVTIGTQANILPMPRAIGTTIGTIIGMTGTKTTMSSLDGGGRLPGDGDGLGGAGVVTAAMGMEAITAMTADTTTRATTARSMPIPALMWQLSQT